MAKTTQNVPKGGSGGQNKPRPGGPAGGGMARGGANVSSTAKTTPGGRGPVPKAR